MKRTTEKVMGPKIPDGVVHYDIEVPMLDEQGKLVMEERRGRQAVVYERKKVSVPATYDQLESSDHGLNTLGQHGSMNVLAFDAGINFKNLPRKTADWHSVLPRDSLIAILPKSKRAEVTSQHNSQDIANMIPPETRAGRMHRIKDVDTDFARVEAISTLLIDQFVSGELEDISLQEFPNPFTPAYDRFVQAIETEARSRLDGDERVFSDEQIDSMIDGMLENYQHKDGKFGQTVMIDPRLPVKATLYQGDDPDAYESSGVTGEHRNQFDPDKSVLNGGVYVLTNGETGQQVTIINAHANFPKAVEIAEQLSVHGEEGVLMFLDANILTEPDPSKDRGKSTTNKEHMDAIMRIRELADRDGWSVSEISSGGLTSDFMLGNLDNVHTFTPEKNGLHVSDMYALYSTLKKGFDSMHIDLEKGASPNEVMIKTLEKAAQFDGVGFSASFTENNLHQYPCHKTFEQWMSNTVAHMKETAGDRVQAAKADRLATAIETAMGAEDYQPVNAGRSRSSDEYRIESFNTYQITQKLVHEQSGVTLLGELESNGLLENFQNDFPSVTAELIQTAKLDLESRVQERAPQIQSGIRD